MLLAGVGRNSSEDSGRDSSCWELVLRKEVRLLVGLNGMGGSQSWGKLGVGTWVGLRVGMGLNSRGEGLWLIYSNIRGDVVFLMKVSIQAS